MNEFEALTNSANIPIIFTYYAEIELSRSTGQYSNDKLNQAIRGYYNGTKNFIAVTESMNVCLNSVEASFQMIIDSCKFSVPALYQLVKNLVFLLKIVFFIFASTNWFKIAISSPNRVIYNEP